MMFMCGVFVLCLNSSCNCVLVLHFFFVSVFVLCNVLNLYMYALAWKNGYAKYLS